MTHLHSWIQRVVLTGPARLRTPCAPAACGVRPALHGNGAQCHFRQTEVLLAAERPLQAGGAECEATGSVLRPTPPALRSRGQQLLGRHRSLGLPQMAVNGDRVHAGGQRLSGDVAKLLPVGIVFVKSLDHFLSDGFRAYPSQFIDFFSFWTVSVQRPELTA